MSLPVIITTTGSTFSPSVALKAGSTGTVTWACPGASITTTGLQPTLSFGSAATRTVYMTVADANGYEAIDQVELFNLGFDHTNDAGTYSLSSSYDWTAQSVSGVAGLHYMTGLKYFLAANIGGLTGTLDFSGLSALLNIELYNSGVTGVVVEGCGSLLRMVLESNNLTTLDINPVASSIREVRAAFQDTGKLTIAPLSNSFFPVDYHFCVRDQILTGIPNLSTVLPGVKELWIWNTRQGGAFTPVSPGLDWVLAHSNNYTSADLTDQMTTANSILDLSANQLATCDLTGCTGLKTITLCDNAFSQSEVNTILTVVDGWGTSGGTLNLSGNPAPSGGGSTAKTNLQSRGWTVTTGPGGAVIVQTAHASGGASVSFANPVTPGNTVIYVVGAYTQSSGAISSSAPKLNGSAVTGAAAAFNPGGSAGLNSGFNSGDGVYLTAWMLPNCPAANGLSLTVTGAAGVTGTVAYEVSGIGSSPSFHRAFGTTGATGTGIDAGQMGQTSIAPTVVLGLAQAYAGVSGGPGAPWVNTQANTPTLTGIRTATEAGGNESFNWLPTASGSGPWCAGMIVAG